MMQITFTPNAWNDYLSWENDDRKMLKKINSLIRDIQSHPYEGLGKPESLRFDLAGLWSRRIDREHRLVYKVEDSNLILFSCRYHYD